MIPKWVPKSLPEASKIDMKMVLKIYRYSQRVGGRPRTGVTIETVAFVVGFGALPYARGLLNTQLADLQLRD